MDTFAGYASVLDMWYGSRAEWRDEELPLEMDVQLANPAYITHCEAIEREEHR